MISLQGSGSYLQGSTPTLQSAVSPTAIQTTNQSATAPSTAKTTYLNNQAQSQTPTSTFYKPTSAISGYNPQTIFNSQGQGLDYNTYLSQGGKADFSNVQSGYWPGYQTSQPTQSLSFGAPQTQNPTPTGMNGYSGGAGSTQGVYDPYQSPSYQNYLNQYVNSQLPGLSTPQIQQGTVDASQTLANIQKQVAQQTGSALNNPNLSEEALTGRSMAAAKQGSLESAAVQPLLDLYKEQQGQAGTAYGAGLNSAQAEAGYLTGLAKPTTLSPGQSLAQLNPSTGKTNTLASVPSFSAISNPISPSGITTFNQTTGQQNSSLGATPPTLGGNAQQQLAAQYMQNPLIAGYVQATQNSNGDMNAAGVPSQYQAAVNTVLQSQSGGQYSPGNASINQANLAQQQATANELIAPARTATSHLADLQSLANAVNYSSSPIASNIRNQFSSSILTDPNITTLQSAIGVVRAEVAKVLGGGTPTVASQAEAAAALPDNLSPQNIAGVIAQVQQLMDQKIQEYSNPTNAASLPTGLEMPSTNSTGLQMPAAGSLSL